MTINAIPPSNALGRSRRNARHVVIVVGVPTATSSVLVADLLSSARFRRSDGNRYIANAVLSAFSDALKDG